MMIKINKFKVILLPANSIKINKIQCLNDMFLDIHELILFVFLFVTYIIISIYNCYNTHSGSHKIIINISTVSIYQYLYL
jgi:hypothetical protein